MKRETPARGLNYEKKNTKKYFLRNEREEDFLVIKGTNSTQSSFFLTSRLEFENVLYNLNSFPLEEEKKGDFTKFICHLRIFSPKKKKMYSNQDSNYEVAML